MSCTNEKGARKALLDSGFYPVEVGGYDWWGCGENDFYSTKFVAYSNDSSRVVKGCVCEGLFKSKTIRVD